MSDGSQALRSLEEEIEQLPDATDSLMDEIDQMETVDTKSTADPLTGPAAKYSVAGADGSNDTTTEAALAPGEAGGADAKDEGAAGEEDKDAPETEEQPEKIYAERSFFCIPRDNAVRKFCKPILDHKRFDQLSLTVIGLNCCTLALFDPLDPNCDRTKCKVISMFDWTWTIFFIVEFVFKWFVMGFSGKGGYWEDSWNRLDFTIVMFSLFDFMPAGVEIPGTSALRTLRAIRPLRALNKFPSLRILVNLLCETLPQMASVAILCFFIFFVMGIFAVQLWQGLFRQRCYSPVSNEMFGDANEDAYICGHVDGADQQSGMNSCAPDDCENVAYSSCIMQGPNPYWGTIHFDHIFGAWVSIFQCITLEAWVDIMYMTQDGYGFWAWLYFVFLIIIGSWFAVNLCLVVISANFGSTKSDQLAQMASQVARERALKEQQERQDLRRKKLTWIEKLMIRVGRPPVKTEDDLAREERVAKIEALEVEMDECKSEAEKEKMKEKLNNLDQELKALDEFHGDNDEEAATGVFLLCDVDGNGELNLGEFKTHFKAKFGVTEDKCEEIFAEMDSNSDGVLTEQEFRAGYVAFKDAQRNVCIRYRVKLRRTVMSDDFGNLIMSAIGVNVVFMAIEFHGQPDELTAVVDVANFFFCMVFAAEMVLKLLSIGILEYVSDGFNIFDGTIVVISIVELIGGGGGLSVLRTFRLVRVFRLISFLPSLQKQISVMIQTLGEVGSFLLILFLFIFIISIVGMFIFGGQFTWDENGDKCNVETDYANNGFVWRDGCVTDRKNFDSFNWAMITVFQVLTQEDWNAVMYNGVRSMGFVTVIYPIFLIVFGNYILFNLFVAILIDGFAAPPEDEEEEEGEEGAELEDAPAVAPIAGAESPAAKAGTGSGTGLSPVEGSGVGCGTGMELTVNPVAAKPRATPRRRHRVIDELIPGVPTNRRLLNIWGRSQAKRGPLTAWTGPVSRVGASSSSSQPGSGTGSGFGDDAAAKDMIQSEDAVTTVTPMEVEAGKDSAVAEAKPEDAAPAPAIVDPATSCRHRDTALFCFGPESKLRQNCQYVVDDTTKHGIWLDRFIMGTIICNSFTLAMERPSILAGSTERLILDIAGNTFSFIFSVEFIIKIIAWNFVFGPKETPSYRKYKGPGNYWSEGWNQLDGTLVIISWIDLIMSQLPISGGPIMGLLKIFRILRALRPLRAVNKLPGLKLVVNCLLASLAPIGTTLIIVFTIFFIFGILGTQLFKGKMSYCAGASWVDDSSLPESAAAVRAIIAKEDCEYYNGFQNSTLGVNEALSTAWTTHYYNFDNLFQSLLTLFVLSSIDGWVDIMYQGTDAADDEYGEPIENNNWVMALYFVAFLLLGGFLILNMFVGVILENFNQAQEAEEEKVRREIAAGDRIEEPVPEPVPDPLDGDFYVNYGPFRRRVYDMVRTDTFDSIIAAVIMSNVTIMATEHYDPSDGFKVFLKVQNYTFSFIFLIEYIIKNIAYGLLYYGDNWSRFDFFLVLVSIFDLVTEFVEAGLPINPTILRVARVMRIARILRLMKGQWAEDLRKLLVTVKNSLAQAGNLGLLLFLLYFICACLGIELFGRLACTEANPCEGMNNKANFEHFFIAVLTLFRLSTGDNWNGILKDALREPPLVDADTCDYSVDCMPGCGATNSSTCCTGCDPADDCLENCCASSWMSPIYFCFFILAAQFVMLNLVVAVLMKELGDAEKADALEQERLEQEGRRKSGIDESTSVEVLGEEGDKTRRKSFSDTMADGGKYWSRRFSQARNHKNVMYDFPDDSGKNVETIVAGTGPTVETSESDLLPVQTGQSTTSPATPDRIAEAASLPERPPTRSAWGTEAQ